MDFTSAWLFGLGHGTNFLLDKGEADAYFDGIFQYNGLAFFWRSEFSALCKVLGWVGVGLVPRETYKAHRDLQSWCMGFCDRALERLGGGKMEIPLCSDDDAYPLVYAHLREKLSQSDFPREKFESSLVAELLDHMVASQDVGGVTTTSMMYQLSQHPEVQRALHLELREHFPDRKPMASELDSLPLLDAILMETLRLHAASPGPWRRYTTATSTCIGEYPDIPPYTILSASAYVMHRNEDVFPDPGTWLPQRWLEAGVEEKKQMLQWYCPFGIGARMCIGDFLATYSMFLNS